MDCEPGKPKWLIRGNPEEMPHRSNTNCMRMRLRDSLFLGQPICLSTYTVLCFLLINTLLISLLSIFVGILLLQNQGVRAWSLTTDPVAWIGDFVARTWTQSLWPSHTPVFLPGESHGQRSLAGYSLWGHKELDVTEWLTYTHPLLICCSIYSANFFSCCYKVSN